MNEKILVTYASRFGTTAGVAEAIGKTLAEAGAQVEVLPMSEVKDLAPYRAVVAGSAINSGDWLPEAMAFVRDHQAELQRKPFAAFLVCMTLTMKNAEKYRGHVSTWLEPVRALVRSVSEGLFAGGLDIGKTPSFSDQLKFRLSVLFGVWLPARFVFVHQAGENYRHYIEATFFGLPFLEVNEGYLDGESFFESPMGGTSYDDANTNQGANLALWAEAGWFPSVWLTDSRVK